ncbi:MAG: AmmeMemoRadiSam system protein B [Thermoguttaceae bacterium]|nr:AmmeMemoRadiSam system protein B [Thermoguttaceae bacterium]MDW8079036.1 AmmeMemoRadiSam system protein B [Thermoguttaceae bacterium]
MTSKIRSPAVAGVFYPANRESLIATVDRLLSQAPDLGLSGVRALIVPHAGYTYSGPVAAVAYRQIRGAPFRRVVILAPSHFGLFRGVAVVAEGVFSTPLGDVPIDPLAKKLAECAPFFPERPVPAEVPGWAAYCLGMVPRQELPHRWEHSIEVQLPFLQRCLQEFSLIPALLGEVNPREVAETLSPFVDEETLLIASSDLSHYLPQEEANVVDQATLEKIRRLDTTGAADLDACGRLPIATLLHLAQQFGWQPQILEYKTSGDISGDYSAVVGYAAVAFCGLRRDSAEAAGETTEAAAGPPLHDLREGKRTSLPKEDSSAVSVRDTPRPWGFSPQEKQILLDLAREAIRRAVCQLPPPQVHPAELPERLRRPGACFVTLKVDGQLRGCIGTLSPKEPLYLAVIRRAEAAATSDPRFPPVGPEELDRLSVAISVLGECRPLEASTPEEILIRLEPGRHGVVLRVGSHHATFLPQVWEHFPDKIIFLEKLAAKAGLFPDAWRRPEARIEVYEAEILSTDDEAQPDCGLDTTA